MQAQLSPLSPQPERASSLSPSDRLSPHFSSSILPFPLSSPAHNVPPEISGQTIQLGPARQGCFAALQIGSPTSSAPYPHRHRSPSAAARLLHRAAPLLCHGPAAPVHPSPGRGSQQLRHPARKLLESSPLNPKPCPCRNRAEDRCRYPAPPSKFLAAGDLCTLLTPQSSSQEPPEAI
jgi:hypothetical protein